MGKLRDARERVWWQFRLLGQRLRAAWKQRGYLPCGSCGGPHRFDTSVPSVVWNAVIRKKGLSDYLCLSCVVREFVREGRSFTATLWGGGLFEEGLSGIPIEIQIGGQAAEDAARISDENTALRVKLREICVAAQCSTNLKIFHLADAALAGEEAKPICPDCGVSGQAHRDGCLCEEPALAGEVDGG